MQLTETIGCYILLDKYYSMSYEAFELTVECLLYIYLSTTVWTMMLMNRQ